MKYLSLLPFAALIDPIFSSPRVETKISAIKTYNLSQTQTAHDYQKSSTLGASRDGNPNLCDESTYKLEKYKTKSRTKASESEFPTLSPSSDGYPAADAYRSNTGVGVGTGSLLDLTETPSTPTSIGKAPDLSGSLAMPSLGGSVTSGGGISLPTGCSQKKGIGIG